MSRRNGSGPKLELKLNLSPPRINPGVESPRRSATVSPTSPPSSCVSSELNHEDTTLRYSNSPEATSMVLVGCPRCLMYVMLSEDDPKCPKCKSTVLLDFLHDNTTTTTTAMKTRRSQSRLLFTNSATIRTYRTFFFFFSLISNSASCVPPFFAPCHFTSAKKEYEYIGNGKSRQEKEKSGVPVALVFLFLLPFLILENRIWVVCGYRGVVCVSFWVQLSSLFSRREYKLVTAQIFL